MVFSFLIVSYLLLSQALVVFVIPILDCSAKIGIDLSQYNYIFLLRLGPGIGIISQLYLDLGQIMEQKSSKEGYKEKIGNQRDR